MSVCRTLSSRLKPSKLRAARAFSDVADMKYVGGLEDDTGPVQKAQDPLARTGAYKLGITEELMIRAPEPVKRALSVDNGSQAEIVKFNKRMHIEKFQRRNGDTGSSEVQSKPSSSCSLL